MIFEQLHSPHSKTVLLGESFKVALDFLKTADFTTAEINKKYPIGDFGDKLFFIRNEFQTQLRDSRKPEQHRDFIDIHYLLSGTEVIGVCFDNTQHVVSQKYSKENDVILFSEVVNESSLILTEGAYAVFFPSDIHRPGGMLKQSELVNKVVIKIAMELLTKHV